jgi:hypothetical protein
LRGHLFCPFRAVKTNAVAMSSKAIQTRREPFPSLLLAATSVVALLVFGCGPVNIREVANPHEAFLGRWLIDSDSRLVVDHALMVEGGIHENGWACANRYQYEVVDQSQDLFELTVKIRKPFSGQESLMTYEFSADRRKMRAKSGRGSWATHVDAGIVDREFENLEEILHSTADAAE